jgi:1-deoxy-D-xylulose-5-phosphate reductoisomerase
MGDIIEKTMRLTPYDANPSYDTYVQTDAEARRIAASLLKS